MDIPVGCRVSFTTGRLSQLLRHVNPEVRIWGGKQSFEVSVVQNKAVMRLKVMIEDGHKLSPLYRALADFALSHPDELAFSTAAELARRVGASEATVIRFARSIGYPGYAEFRSDFQASVRTQLTTVRRLRESERGRGSADEDVVRQVLREESRNLERIGDIIDQPVFDRLARRLLRADPLYVAGVRASACLASYLAYQAAEVLPNVTMITSGSSDNLSRLRPADNALLIAFAFPRYPREIVRIVEIATSVGVPVVAVTDSFSSPVVRNSVECILLPHQSSRFVDLFAAPITVAAALLETAARQDGEAVVRGLERFEERARLLSLYTDDESV